MNIKNKVNRVGQSVPRKRPIRIAKIGKIGKYLRKK